VHGRKIRKAGRSSPPATVRPTVQVLTVCCRMSRSSDVIDFETDLNDFCAWGIDTGQDRARVLSFVRFKPPCCMIRRAA